MPDSLKSTAPARFPRNTPECFLSCDWGSTSFRLRLARWEDCAVQAEIAEPFGIKRILGSLGGDQGQRARARSFEEYLAGSLRRLLAEAGREELATEIPLDIVISGMASSSVGWKELPYARLPQSVGGEGIPVCPIECSSSDFPWERFRVALVSGVRSDDDMMRGEETEIIGLFTFPQLQPMAVDCWVVLPGTHSKHVRIQDGMILAIRTYMTGEMFEVMSEHSLLKASVAATAGRGTPAAGGSKPEIGTGMPDHLSADDAFVEGVEKARERGLEGALFGVRTRSVLDALDPDACRSLLSGMLIGAELMAGVNGTDKSAAPIVLAATGRLYGAYHAAAKVLGLSSRIVDWAAADHVTASVRGQQKLLRNGLTGS